MEEPDEMQEDGSQGKTCAAQSTSAEVDMCKRKFGQASLDWSKLCSCSLPFCACKLQQFCLTAVSTASRFRSWNENSHARFFAPQCPLLSVNPFERAKALVATYVEGIRVSLFRRVSANLQDIACACDPGKERDSGLWLIQCAPWPPHSVQNRLRTKDAGQKWKLGEHVNWDGEIDAVGAFELNEEEEVPEQPEDDQG
eukprot:2292137-Amphidinium_carterae.1